MNGELSLCFDSSALVKLVRPERESDAVRALLGRSRERYASALVRAEVPRAARRVGSRAIARAHRVVDEFDLIEADDVLLAESTTVGDAALRTLDAIHLAAALSLGDDLDALVTYDRRLAEAAIQLGITVEAPR